MRLNFKKINSKLPKAPILFPLFKGYSRIRIQMVQRGQKIKPRHLEQTVSTQMQRKINYKGDRSVSRDELRGVEAGLQSQSSPVALISVSLPSSSLSHLVLVSQIWQIAVEMKLRRQTAQLHVLITRVPEELLADQRPKTSPGARKHTPHCISRNGPSDSGGGVSPTPLATTPTAAVNHAAPANPARTRLFVAAQFW